MSFLLNPPPPPPQVYIEPFWAAEESIFCAFSLLPANLAILAFLQYIKILKLHNKNYYYEFNYRYYLLKFKRQEDTIKTKLLENKIS